MKKILRNPFSIIIFAFCFLMLALGLVLPDTSFSELENRYLAGFPYLDMDSIQDGSFFEDYETYVNEQFPLRNGWIQLKSVLETVTGKRENNGIVRGSDDYLFQKQLTVGEQLYENEDSVLDFAGNAAGDVSIMIVPTSYGVLKDKLPPGLPNFDQMKEISGFNAKLEEARPGSVIDMPALLSGMETEEQLYYRTDHHWTTDAAYAAYEAFCARKGYTPVDASTLLKRQVPGFTGTYAAKFKGYNGPADTIVYYDIPIASMELNGEETVSSLYDLDKSYEYDKYAMFLHGNYGLSLIRTSAEEKPEEEKRKLLVMKDSYANCLIPFLTFHYDEIYVVDLRYYARSVASLMHEQGIADVLLLYNFDTLITDRHFYRMADQQAVEAMNQLSASIMGEGESAPAQPPTPVVQPPDGLSDNSAPAGGVSGNSVSDNTVPEPTVSDNEAPAEEPAVNGIAQGDYVLGLVDETYFNDALFIGDSRVEGLALHSGLNATFYAEKGLHIKNIFSKEIVKTPEGRTTVLEGLAGNRFAKVYIMLGINELGWGTDEMFLEMYTNVINTVKVSQPGAVIYLQGIIHVSEKKDAADPVHRNEYIIARNRQIQALAQEMGVVYIDPNEVLTDENGFLHSEFTSDGVHLKAYYIELWKQYLMAHAVLNR